MSNTTLKVLMLGDLFGKTGRQLFARHIAPLQKKYAIDITVVNGENCADGKGITSDIATFLFRHNVQVITSGNHIWDKKEIVSYFNQHTTLLRPANYPDECPGSGIVFIPCKGVLVGIINLMGRLSMPVTVDCPFVKAYELIATARVTTPLLFVDFHAEIMAEKQALAHALDGSVTALVGTHTHLQTADATILSKGTAYLSDLGMGGSFNSMIGAKKEPLIEKMITQMPTRIEVDRDPPYIFNGAVITADLKTGKALAIETVAVIDCDPL